MNFQYAQELRNQATRVDTLVVAINRLAGCLALAVNPAWGEGCRMEVIAGSLVTKTIFSRELSEWEAEPDPKGNGF